MSKFTGKKILVVGFGRSGYAASKVLLKNKAKVVINDVAKTHPEEKIREVKKLGAASLRLAFTLESEKETEKILKEFAGVYLRGQAASAREFTKGHFKRGAE